MKSIRSAPKSISQNIYKIHKIILLRSSLTMTLEACKFIKCKFPHKLIPYWILATFWNIIQDVTRGLRGEEFKSAVRNIAICTVCSVRIYIYIDDVYICTYICYIYYIYIQSWKQCAFPVITTMALWQLMVITGRAHCFHDCIYIAPVLLLWDLSTLCVVDHLWPLVTTIYTNNQIWNIMLTYDKSWGSNKFTSTTKFIFIVCNLRISLLN